MMTRGCLDRALNMEFDAIYVIETLSSIMDYVLRCCCPMLALGTWIWMLPLQPLQHWWAAMYIDLINWSYYSTNKLE